MGKPRYIRVGKIDGLDAFMRLNPDPLPDTLIVDDLACDLGGNLTPKLNRMLPTPFCRAKAKDWVPFVRYATAWGFFKPL